LSPARRLEAFNFRDFSRTKCSELGQRHGKQPLLRSTSSVTTENVGLNRKIVRRHDKKTVKLPSGHAASAALNGLNRHLRFECFEFSIFRTAAVLPRQPLL
jgi:hypothetical protein